MNWFTGLLDIETLLFANCYMKISSLQLSDVFGIRMYCGESVNPRVSYMTFRPSSCPKGSIVYSRFRRRGKLETCRDSRRVGNFVMAILGFFMNLFPEMEIRHCLKCSRRKIGMPEFLFFFDGGCASTSLKRA